MALRAVLEFIDGDSRWRDENLRAPFDQVILGLQRIDDGAVVEWLTPHSEGGRPCTPRDIAAMQVRIAGVQSWLMTAARPRMQREDAAAAILRHHGRQRAGALLGPRGDQIVTWRAIDRWRQDINNTADHSIWADHREFLTQLTARFGNAVPRIESERLSVTIIDGATRGFLPRL
jgi:hypothetical protein